MNQVTIKKNIDKVVKIMSSIMIAVTVVTISRAVEIKLKRFLMDTFTK